MFKKISAKEIIIMIPVAVLLLVGCKTKDSISPKVISTIPENGAQEVVSSLTEISVTFNEAMIDQSWSWSYDDKDKFPQVTGQPYYTDNNTRCVLPVNLDPEKEYVIWINTINFKNFKDKAGNPVEPYRFIFRTK